MSDIAHHLGDSFVRHNPGPAGILFAALGVVVMVVSLRAADRILLLEGIAPASGTVVSIQKTQSIPPRWDARVRMADATVATVRVGPAFVDIVHPGMTVSLLVPPRNAALAVLPQQLPERTTIDLWAFHVTWLFFVGLGFILAGFLLARFGARFFARFGVGPPIKKPANPED